MPKGFTEKIFYIIRPNYEDEDRINAEMYFGKIKDAKENKGFVLMIKDGVKQGENHGISAVFVSQKEVALAESKNYKEHGK